jgi:hypothetical protein
MNRPLLIGRPIFLVALVACQFGICRAFAASPFVQWERIKVTGWAQGSMGPEVIPHPPLSLYKGEATRTAQLTIGQYYRFCTDLKRLEHGPKVS